MTAWTEHLKKFASDKGISYRDAMRHPDAKASYKSGGKIFKTPKEVKHEFQHPKEIVGRGHSVGHLEEQVQDIAGNWVIPAPVVRANKQTPSFNPSFQSKRRMNAKAQELLADTENALTYIHHTPLTPLKRGRPTKGSGMVAQHGILGEDDKYQAVSDNTLGLGANAGKHYISL